MSVIDEMAGAPWSRLRLRQSPHLRDLCAEITFTTAHLIQPIFVVEGLAAAEPIAGLDGNARLGLDEGLDAIARDRSARRLDRRLVMAIARTTRLTCDRAQMPSVRAFAARRKAPTC